MAPTLLKSSFFVNSRSTCASSKIAVPAMLDLGSIGSLNQRPTEVEQYVRCERGENSFFKLENELKNDNAIKQGFKMVLK